MKINGFINGQKLKINQPLIVADTIDYLTANFSFQTSDWGNADKWVHFKQGEKTWDINLVDDEITADKHLNLSQGEWEVYVHGNYGNTRITTEIQKIIVKQTGILKGEPLPEIPLSTAEQINLKASNAEKIAMSVRNDADSGKFNGAKGDKGNVMYATFDVDTQTGELSMTYDEEYKGAMFDLNKNGELEVNINA